MKHKPSPDPSELSCPLPIRDYPHVLLAHGGGGRLMRDLIEKMFVPAIGGPLLEQRHDGAVFEAGKAKLAFTTDSFVVRPLFFPGGDIGTLAVNGTVNDLAMCGARPLYLSAGLILEEGLPMEALWKVVQSMQQAARAAGVQFATGDTKVVDRGKGDGIFINTSGVGVIEHRVSILPRNIRPGDAILLSGDLGRHGIAVMNAREGLALESRIESDCEAVAAPVLQLLECGIEVHCLRDLTRGGLASALIEIAEDARLGIEIDENLIPVREDVRGACEILGLDPLYVANEGRFVALVRSGDAQQALKIMRSHACSEGACSIGTVTAEDPAMVRMKSAIGVSRIVDMLSGEQLPRIC